MRTFLATALALLWLPTAGHAALEFGNCDKSWECAKLRVPLDHSGGRPGAIDLHVERIASQNGKRATGALLALAGGPGQAATTLTGDFNNFLFPALRTRDLIVFDQRGTGSSGVLRCPGLQNTDMSDAGDEAAACAERLGPKRAFFTARDAVADMEALRQALEIDKISIYGVSYGVKLALAYAASHPTHVERLILDSVLHPSGPDAFYRQSMAATPRVLGALCQARCGAITPDPVADLAQIVDRIAAEGLTATAYDGRGGPHAVAVRSIDLFNLLHTGDLFVDLRGLMPAALRSAALGDTALLGRLLYVPERLREDSVGSPVREFSQAMFAAATCEETDLPWERTARPAERPGQARARAELLGASVFEPFDAEAALASDTIRMCVEWPAAAEAPVTPAGPFPDVPVLIMNGENDLRTPLAWAEEVADRFPRSTLVTDAVGHSVLFASECAQAAVEAFFSGRAPDSCRRRRRVPLRELPPRSLEELRPLGSRGLRGRTIRAFESTLRDIASRLQGELVSFDGKAVRAGGLRGGWIRVARRSTLGGYLYVPGVRVSGTIRIEPGRRGLIGGEFTLSGRDAARGRVQLRGGRLVGALDGARVKARLQLPTAGGRS